MVKKQFQMLKLPEKPWEYLRFTAQKMTFSIKDFFSKCDQIRDFLRNWSHLLTKSLMKNFIFCAVFCVDYWPGNPRGFAVSLSSLSYFKRFCYFSVEFIRFDCNIISCLILYFNHFGFWFYPVYLFLNSRFFLNNRIVLILWLKAIKTYIDNTSSL